MAVRKRAARAAESEPAAAPAKAAAKAGAPPKAPTRFDVRGHSMDATHDAQGFAFPANRRERTNDDVAHPGGNGEVLKA